MNRKECKHGHLARSCEVCALEKEVERLQAENVNLKRTAQKRADAVTVVRNLLTKYRENESDLRRQLAEARADRDTAKRLLDSACIWIDGADHHDGCERRNAKSCSCGLDEFKRIRSLIPAQEDSNAGN